MKSMIILTGVVVLLAATLFGQGATGSVSGVVMDPSGAVTPNAIVVLKNATGLERRTNSSDQGVFAFPLVGPGTYSVTVEVAGFKRFLSPDVVVEVSKETRLSVPLQIGEASAIVTVESAAVQDMVNTTSATITSVIDLQQVRNLPISSTDPIVLAALVPGIAITGTNVRDSSVSGLRQTATNVTQDGINAMDNLIKTSSFFVVSSPSLNSTSEFSVTTGTLGADSGRGVAQLRLVTLGGGNDLHGSLWYLMRNSALEANSFFNNANGTPRTDEHQHYFGFTAGGPVLLPHYNGRDKSLWFFSYEGFRENFGATRNRTVLTPEARNGLYRYVGADGSTQTVNLISLGTFKTLNSLTTATLNKMPAPNNTLLGDGLNTAGYRFNLTGSDPSDKILFRFDQKLVQASSLGSHKAEFILSREADSLFPDTGNSIDAPFPGGVSMGQASKRWLITAALHSTFGSATNEVRWGRQWSPVGFFRQSQPTAPFISFASVTNFDNTNMDQGRKSSVTQVIDNFALPIGSHVLRAGFDFQQLFSDPYSDGGINQTITLGTNAANPNGIVNSLFPNLPAGAAGTTIVNRASAIYNDLAGMLASSTQTFNVTSPTSGFVPGATRLRQFQQRDVALYLSDQWRTTRNLTLNYGLRWEYEGVPTIPNGLGLQVTNVNDMFGISGPGNLFNPNAPTGAAPAKATLDFVGGNTGRALYKNDWNNFAPSIGLAYSPDFAKGLLHRIFGEHGTSSFRGGYSISYLHDGLTIAQNVLGTGTTNPGLTQTAANTVPTGVLTAAGVALTTPTFKTPVTDLENYNVNPGNGLVTFNPNLRIPYVQQWSIGFERAITRNTAFEIRYVANHAIKMWRSNDYNEVNIFENGFVNEFLNAQKNLAINGGASFAPGAAGTVPLPILATLFTGLANGSGFGSSGFISNLNNNNVGTMAATLATSATYRTNRTTLPANFFLVNPNSAFVRILDNGAMSNYNALQVEIRRRFSRGLQFSGDYTFGKALTDGALVYGDVQNDNASFRTLRNRSLDYRRSQQDQTHRFVFNSVYDLPFGANRAILGNAHGVLNQIVGGWTLGAIVTWQTRPPFFIAANRTTFNSFNGATSNPAQLVGISFEDFKKNVGVFRRPEGVYFINPDILDVRTDPTTGKYISSPIKAGLLGPPAPGTFGNFPMNSINGPRYFNTDLSIVKNFRASERVSVDLKTTMINAFNHTNFIAASGGSPLNFDSSTFGLISSQSGTPRIIHFTLTTRW